MNLLGLNKCTRKTERGKNQKDGAKERIRETVKWSKEEAVKITEEKNGETNINSLRAMVPTSSTVHVTLFGFLLMQVEQTISQCP